MRGLNILKPLSVMVFISYYIISPPLQYLFGYTCGFNVSGLWGGQMCGAAFHLGS